MGRIASSAGRPAEPLEAELRELGELVELLGEHRGADRGQPVRPAAVDGRQGLDQAALLETGERGVQGSRTERAGRCRISRRP